MNGEKGILFMAIALVALATAMNVWASGSKAYHIALKPAETRRGAIGKAVIDDQYIFILASGLHPGSTYTV